VELVVGCVHPEYGVEPPSDLRVRVWDCPQVRHMLWPLVQYLRNEKPDVVFSAEDHLNTFLLLAALWSGLKAKISGSSRVTPFDTFPVRVAPRLGHQGVCSWLQASRLDRYHGMASSSPSGRVWVGT
jgi:hypothetical protein